MTHDPFNCDTSRARTARRSESNGRIVGPDWNGQAAPAIRSNVVQTKTGAFKVELSGGAVTVKKAVRLK